MPKLKEVETSKNSMSWKDVKVHEGTRNYSLSIPKRELETFLGKGYKIAKVTVTFEKDKELEINKLNENGNAKENTKQ